MCDLFRSRSLRAPLFVSVIMHISQQLSGINAVSEASLLKFPLGFFLFLFVFVFLSFLSLF